LFVGKNIEVLITKEGRHSGQLVGRSQYSQAVTINNANGLCVGDIVEVSVKSAVSHSLVGEKYEC
jgi:tRNA-2-methylthio-N6-dimethylallyladenosine synthase